MIPAETITVASENQMLDLVIWKKFKRQMPGYLERVLDANIGLAKQLEFIPPGTRIFMPAVEDLPQKTSSEVVRLWY